MRTRGALDHRRVDRAAGRGRDRADHAGQRSLVTVVDREDFPTLGRGMWWALQTVTTVGYGDVTGGRAIAAVVMVTGTGFVTVVTAAITASFVEATRRRVRREDLVLDHLRAIEDRLEEIERRLGG